jgi:hypothetical protein
MIVNCCLSKLVIFSFIDNLYIILYMSLKKVQINEFRSFYDRSKFYDQVILMYENSTVRNLVLRFKFR